MVRQSAPDSPRRPGGADQVRWFPVFRGQAGRCGGTVRGSCGAGFRWPRDRGQDSHDASQGRPDVRLGNVLQEGRATLPSGESVCKYNFKFFIIFFFFLHMFSWTILYCIAPSWYEYISLFINGKIWLYLNINSIYGLCTQKLKNSRLQFSILQSSCRYGLREYSVHNSDKFSFNLIIG